MIVMIQHGNCNDDRQNAHYTLQFTRCKVMPNGKTRFTLFLFLLVIETIITVP